MYLRLFVTIIFISTPLAATAARPEPICAAFAQSHLNAAIYKNAQSQGCFNTVDGLILDIVAHDDLGEWEYTAWISNSCTTPGEDYCCVNSVKLNGSDLPPSGEFSYNNKGQLKRDQRELSAICEQLMAVP